MINELEAQVSVLEQQDYGNRKGFSMWKLLFVSVVVFYYILFYLIKIVNCILNRGYGRLF